ncbi:DnaJ domain-containing protein [Cyathus striatus]|nr:DnaJ domain-containing protein [Cyathus striatus]
MYSPSFSTWYDVLGVDQSATDDEVRRAYRRKALETHPDRLGPFVTDEEKQYAEDAFHKIQKAFEVLGDIHNRKAYDVRLAVKFDPGSMSDAAVQRMADREAWAKQRRERQEKRIHELQRQRKELESGKLPEKTGNNLSDPDPLLSPEAKMYTEILKDLYTATPELEERMKAILRRKAEREQAEMHNRRPQPTGYGLLR